MSVETLDNDFVTQLGLTRAPFVAGEAVSANFVSPIREGQLQKAAHQIRYGELMMVVVGTKGSGKTFFLDKLELDLVDLPQIIRLDIGADTSPEAFLLSILAGLRPQAILEQPQPIGALLASIRAVLAQCSEPPVLILDNAGQLADKELAMLLSLIASVGGAVAMKTVMAGDQALVSRLDNSNFKALGDLGLVMIIAVVDYNQKEESKALIDKVTTTANQLTANVQDKIVFGHVDGVKWRKFMSLYDAKPNTILILHLIDDAHITLSDKEASLDNLNEIAHRIHDDTLLLNKAVPRGFFAKTWRKLVDYFPASLLCFVPIVMIIMSFTVSTRADKEKKL